MKTKQMATRNHNKKALESKAIQLLWKCFCNFPKPNVCCRTLDISRAALALHAGSQNPVAGQPDPKTGFIIDLKQLSKIVKKHIVDIIDHSNLNVDVPFLKGKMPSIEIMVIEFWKIIDNQLADYECNLHCLKLIETENNYVEYYGE